MVFSALFLHTVEWAEQGGATPGAPKLCCLSQRECCGFKGAEQTLLSQLYLSFCQGCSGSSPSKGLLTPLVPPLLLEMLSVVRTCHPEPSLLLGCSREQGPSLLLRCSREQGPAPPLKCSREQGPGPPPLRCSREQSFSSFSTSPAFSLTTIKNTTPP